MSFHQGCDVTVAAAGEQITLPMTGNGAVITLSRQLPAGDGLNELTLGTFPPARACTERRISRLDRRC